MDDPDAALAAVLADTGTSMEPVTGATHTDPAALDTLDDLDADVEVCSEEEARQLVETARQSITMLHGAMSDIIRRRAWIALGYESPERFWVKEFAGDESEGGLGYSRSYLYRTAHVLSVLYGLYQRIGDAAFQLDLSERAIRAISSNDGEGGEGLTQVMDEIEARVKQLPDPSKDEVSRVADEVIAEARERGKQGRVEATAEDLAEGLAMFGLGSMTPDPDPFTPDGDFDDDGDDGGPVDESWREEYEEREGLSIVDDPTPTVDADGLKYTLLVADLTRAIELFTRVAAAPTDAVLSRMNPAEVERLAEGADHMIGVLETMRDWANSDEAPIDLSTDY